MAANVYMFLIQASSAPSNERHPAGTSRTLLVFVRHDEGETANTQLCETIAKTCGWTDVKVQGISIANPETVQAIQKTPEPAVDKAYADVFKKGFGLLVFGDAA